MTTEEHSTNPSRKGMLLTLLSVAVVIVVSVAGFVYQMTAPRIMTPKELVANGAIMYEEPRPVLPFELVTQEEEAFTPENLQDKWTLLFFGFTHCPDFCPTTLATLRDLVKQLDVELQQQLQVAMVSVDPSRDTPERLLEYFQAFQFDDTHTDFVGVTGEFIKIKIMADHFYIPIQKKMLDTGDPDPHAAHSASGSESMPSAPMDHSQPADAREDQNNYTVIHGEHIVLIDPRGQFHGIFKPPFTVARLKATLRSIVAVYD